MALTMHQNSLFAVLLRSPWWISIAVAAGTGVLARFALAKFSMPEIYAVFIALPFLVIGGYAAWQQLRSPGAARIAATLEALRALSREEFSAALEDAFRREGYTVSRNASSGAAGADLELARAGRVTLVACKRWKVARTGIEPLKELEAAREARGAHECILAAAGEITGNATAFAAAKNIRLLHGAALAKLLPQAGKRG